MRPFDIATTAANLVDVQRAEDHGDYAKNLGNIARLWQAYLHALFERQGMNNWGIITGDNVADMMELLKIGRRLSGRVKLDDYIDACGYAAIAGAIRIEEENGGNAVPLRKAA